MWYNPAMMRWLAPSSIRATLVAIACALFVPASVRAANAAADGGVAEFIRTHPGYRGYLTPHPPYPLAARAQRAQGSVAVKVTFSKVGVVTKVELSKSSGSPILDSNTVQYIQKYWRSTLGRPTTHSLTMEYSLRR